MIQEHSALAFIPLFPLIGALLAYVLGRVNKDLSGWIATGATLLSFVWVVNCFVALTGSHQIEALQNNLFLWFSAGDLSVDFLLRFDRLTAVMCMVITGIGTLIHLYSIGYMHEDEGRSRFFTYLNLFMFSMLLLVLGGNLLVLFVGWEGVGLCSYLLIGFWFKNLAYAGAGRKAFVVNRIGDFGFLIGIFLIAYEFKTLDFVELSNLIPNLTEVISFPTLTVVGFLTLIACALFVGAMGKSAQIPLFVWLPDAMAGPTPVSALIHAATMVTAGVYMMARMNFLFSLAPYALALITIIAVTTALIAAITAVTQNDIKKVLAYSTVSQLGFMFMAAGAGAYWVAVFHLVTHAFFKGCLFLTAGSVIMGCHHEQDMRHMGGLWRYMPITTATYAIATLAIAGIFPFAGFYSKHAILEALEAIHNPYISAAVGHYLSIGASFAALLTAFYMTRSFAMTFLGKYRGHAHPHESPLTMTVPLMALALLSAVGGMVLGGAFGEELAIGHFLSGVLPQHPFHMHEVGIVEQIIHSWIGLVGVGVGLICYTVAVAVPGFTAKLLTPLTILSQRKFFFDEIYGAVIVRPLEGISGVLWRFFDQGVVDGAVNGTAAVVDVSGEVARTIQTGQVRHYAFIMALGTVLIVAMCFLF